MSCHLARITVLPLALGLVGCDGDEATDPGDGGGSKDTLSQGDGPGDAARACYKTPPSIGAYAVQP